MDLRHFRYFLAVAEEAHFGKAADKLHIVQPALSMQIRDLERELGVQLFTRTTRRVELTEAGRLFRVEAERTLAQADYAKRIAQQAARGEVGHVRIAFSGNAAIAGRLAEDIQAFHHAKPLVSIDLFEMAPTDQVQAILENRIDVGYSPDFGLTLPTPLSGELVGEWPWVVGMARNHRLAHSRDVKGADLRDETFIVYTSHTDDRSQSDILNQITGQAAKIGYRVASTLTVLTMAAAGLGLALVPKPLSKIQVPGLMYMPLGDFDEHARLLLISRTTEANGPVLAFREHVRGHL